MSRKSYSEKFRVEPGSEVRLKDHDPDFHEAKEEDSNGKEELLQLRRKISDHQERLYATQAASLLICLQALDAGGKDGTVQHVCGSMNPQGCRVTSFKQPSKEELAHDFLWRIHQATPRDGEVAVFNRSHYEDVLAVRVHNLVPKDVWKRRYKRINGFEKELADHKTVVLKFYLNISKEEQLKRFRDRLEDPGKAWKISESDYSERAYWADYMKAYEDVFEQCSTDHAPWFIIPANHKWFRNLAVAKIIVEQLEGLKLKMPKPTVDLDEIRKQYHTAEAEEYGNTGNGKKEKGE
jgi:PPK2 family polyphosphate:nucleotide phosphotransferase